MLNRIVREIHVNKIANDCVYMGLHCKKSSWLCQYLCYFYPVKFIVLLSFLLGVGGTRGVLLRGIRGSYRKNL